MSAKDIAVRIKVHLQNLENDKKFNKPWKKGGTTPLWLTGCHASGRWVNVQYVSYQGWTTLTKQVAEVYLEKLDAGFKGRHFEALRDH